MNRLWQAILSDWQRLPRRMKIVRSLNVIGLVVIITLFAVHKDRFRAMLNPTGKEIVGQPAPDFSEGVWFNSRPLSLEGLRGQVIVVDFWTFKCRNCLNILPALSEWHRKFKGRGVVIVGVHSPETDEEADTQALRRFLADTHIEFPVLTDNGFTMWNRYRAQFWPSTYIVDGNGIVQRFHYGELGFSSLEEDIVKLIPYVR